MSVAVGRGRRASAGGALGPAWACAAGPAPGLSACWPALGLRWACAGAGRGRWPGWSRVRGRQNRARGELARQTRRSQQPAAAAAAAARRSDTPTSPRVAGRSLVLRRWQSAAAGQGRNAAGVARRARRAAGCGRMGDERPGAEPRRLGRARRPAAVP